MRGAPDFWSDAPVICFSEVTEEARRTMLRAGVGRGRYAPWGLLLDRRQLVSAGARPALPVSREELNQLKAALPPQTYNRCVVYEPNPARGRSDWLHEREWRICFEYGDSMLPVTPQLVVGVIVGTQGWMPPPHSVAPEEKSTKFVTAVLAVRRAMQDNPNHPWQSIPVHSPDVNFAWPAHGLARWYWNGSELVRDGHFDVQALQRYTAWSWGGTLPGISGTVRPEEAREEAAW